jgi:hypothetical protein
MSLAHCSPELVVVAQPDQELQGRIQRSSRKCLA